MRNTEPPKIIGARQASRGTDAAKSRANRVFAFPARSAYAVALSVKIPKNGSKPTPSRQLPTVSNIYEYSKRHQIKDAVYKTDVYGQVQKLVCVEMT